MKRKHGINIKEKTNSILYRTESIERYLESIKDYHILSFDEENDLITKYKVHGDLKARDMLINSNQRFLYSAAKKFTRNPDVVLELINEGTIGMIEALDRFDFTKGCRFMSYAQCYINRNMVNYYCSNRLIKRPNDSKVGYRIKYERDLFISINEREPTVEELRNIMLFKYGIKINKDEDLMDYSIVYSDSCVSSNDESYTFSESKEYTDATCSYNEYDKKADNDETKAIVLAALSKLDKRTAEIVKMIYGIDCEREYTLSEISEMYGMTQTRLLQIKNNATKRLQYLISA